MKRRDIFDVSKGNWCYPLQIVLSAPFVALALVFLFVMIFFIFFACLIGRRPAFQVLDGTLERMLNQ